MRTQTISEQSDGLPLPGLDGTNPLGFLATLGLFRIIDAVFDSKPIRIQWLSGSGAWIPSIIGARIDATSLLDLLEANLAKRIDNHPIEVLDKLGSYEAEERTHLFQQFINDLSIGRRNHLDWLAALASNITPSSTINQLQTARRDYYYGNLISIISRTTRNHLDRTIFKPWDYADPLDNQSLHWDPGEDRRHAHQWNKPAGDPDRKRFGGMLGANRLAIEAIAWFTSLPENEALHTVGFTGQRSYNTRWTWPIWNVPLSAHVIRSILMLAELQHEDISNKVSEQLRYRGIIAAFRTTRILVGKTPNFTPPQQVA